MTDESQITVRTSYNRSKGFFQHPWVADIFDHEKQVEGFSAGGSTPDEAAKACWFKYSGTKTYTLDELKVLTSEHELAKTPSNFEMVKEFHEAFDAPVGDSPQELSVERQELRIELMREELNEYQEAVEAGDLVEMADGLTDLLYVVYGTLVEHGFPADELFAEVHRSNMSKLGDDGKPVLREDGKVLKGPKFTLPDIAGLLQSTLVLNSPCEGQLPPTHFLHSPAKESR